MAQTGIVRSILNVTFENMEFNSQSFKTNTGYINPQRLKNGRSLRRMSVSDDDEFPVFEQTLKETLLFLAHL